MLIQRNAVIAWWILKRYVLNVDFYGVYGEKVGKENVRSWSIVGQMCWGRSVCFPVKMSLSVGIVKNCEEFVEKVGLFCYLDDIFSLCVGVWMEEWVDSEKNSVSLVKSCLSGLVCFWSRAVKNTTGVSE